MDLREIQALHARYADSPAVIDLPGQYARIPAPLLTGPAPSRTGATSTMRQWVRWSGATVLAVAAAGVVGIQAGHIWEHFHRTHGARAVNLKPQHGLVSVAPPPAAHDELANSTLLAKPLSAADFGGDAGSTLASQAAGRPSQSVASAMSHVDAVRVDPPHDTPKTTVSADDEAAMRSPMIERHPAPLPAPVKASEPPVAVQPVAAPVVTVKADPVAAPSDAANVPKHKWHSHTENASRFDDAPKAPSPAAKAASSHAGGDVTLF